MEQFTKEFKEAIESATARLLALSDSQSEIHPAPGKWSPKGIIGHLIDSAANNHRRFVLAQLQEALIFPENKNLTFSLFHTMFLAQFTLRRKFVREIFGASVGALKRGGDPIFSIKMGASGEAC